MTRGQTLREQARVIRSLAGTFDDGAIRHDLAQLAERCEELASQIEQNIRQSLKKPIHDRK